MFYNVLYTFFIEITNDIENKNMSLTNIYVNKIFIK